MKMHTKSRGVVQRISVITLFISLFFFEIQAQSDTTFQLSINSKLLLSANEVIPFWLVSNKYGIYEGDESEFLVQVDADKSFFFGKKFRLDLGTNIVGKNQLDKSYLHELYGNLSFGKLKLIAGKEELTFSQYSESTGTGSYYFSNNARPITRVGLGFYDYTDLPLTNGFIQIKGFLNQGILLDDRSPDGTDKPLFHEKIAYIRTNKLPVNPHVGVNHSALFGGTLPNGTEIPIDYWSTFFGMGSEKIGGGEATNAAGAHLGLFDVGANAKLPNATLQIYVQKPFTDTSGYTRFFENNKDHIAGIVFKNTRENAVIQEFVYENISLLWQSGEGLFDPVINGKVYLPPDLEDKDKIMWEEYGIMTENISDEDFWRFVTKEENYGFQYGGRDNYYNNGLYKKGWSNWGKALGNPLLLTEDRVKKINPDFDSSYDLYFVNTRVFAHHFGLLGEYKNLQFRSLITYSKNFGSYMGLNKGGNNWDSKDPYSEYRYYFEYGLYEVYTYVDFIYTMPSNPAIKISLELGADFGEMYNSFGGILGVSYRPGFKLKTKN
jgi:hypothetical protein